VPDQWQGSDRRSTLPSNWPAIRRPILRRDGRRCTWLGDLDADGRPAEYMAGGYDHAQRCTEHATDVDHIGDRLDHRPQNLRSLCGRHHRHRSTLQGVVAKAQRAALRRRPEQPHPGLRA